MYRTRPLCERSRVTLVSMSDSMHGERPMFQVWTWSESSECGRLIDIHRWAIDYLLDRSLPIPHELRDAAAALLMEWERELKAMDPAVVAQHELGVPRDPRRRGEPLLSNESLPTEAEFDAIDMAVIAGERSWQHLPNDRRLLLLMRMAVRYRAERGGGAPAGLVERLRASARAQASESGPSTGGVERRIRQHEPRPPNGPPSWPSAGPGSRPT